MAKSQYKRVLLKVICGSLKGQRHHGVDPDALDYMVSEIKSVSDMGVELGIVDGGGNIWRGSEAEVEGMDRATADYAGMPATIIRELALQDVMEQRHDLNTRTLSAITVQAFAEPYITRRATGHFTKGSVALFSAGTGITFVCTATVAPL